MDFKLTSAYSPTGDQPTAIRQLVEGIANNEQAQTLLGVTGSGIIRCHGIWENIYDCECNSANQ